MSRLSRMTESLPASPGPLPVGARAPRFELRRTFDETVALNTLLDKGPVLIVFYVFDFGDI